MTDPTHLPPWTIEELAEDTLGHAERELALEHVRRCAQCAGELEASRALIAALASLPAFSPSPSFADAVMARVAIQPAAAVAPARARVRRWLPQTSKGWMGLGALVLVPAAPLVALVAWLFSHPGVSAASLWNVGKGWVSDAAWNFVVRLTEMVVASGVFEWLVTTGNEMVGGTRGLSVAAILFAIAIPVSGWAMVRILRTPMGGMSHAH